MQKLFCCSLISMLVLPVMAETKVNGEVSLDGGLGSAAPWAGNFKLDVSNAKFSFKPFGGITGVTEPSSRVDENLQYQFFDGDNYYSTSTINTSGLKWQYGAALNLSLAPVLNLFANAKVDQSRLESNGTRYEKMSSSDILISGDIFSEISTPELDQDNLHVDAGLSLQMPRPGEKIVLRYAYDMLRDEEMYKRFGTINFVESSFDYFNAYHRKTEDKTKTHTVSANWNSKAMMDNLGCVHILNAGIRYEDRSIDSDTKQLNSEAYSAADILNLGSVFDTQVGFTHDMKTTAASVGYQMRSERLFAKAQLEYDYTKMQEKKLNDFVPMANLTWYISQRDELSAQYMRRIVRPTLEYLNPAQIYDNHVLRYGNPDLEGIHINVAALSYRHKGEGCKVGVTASHIFVDDGFNAMWMLLPPDMDTKFRRETYGNEGKRRAWSVAPDVDWTVSPSTSLSGKVTLLWDKRIAEAISMEKEHWGITAHTQLNQKLPGQFLMQVYADYSEGNTIDLYSHESRSMKYGGELRRSFFSGLLTASLKYSYTEYSRMVITQGAYSPAAPHITYVGYNHNRLREHHMVSLNLSCKL